jgi:hypothetical protein
MLVYDSTNIPEAVGRGTLDPELEAWLPSGPTLGADVPIAQRRRDHPQYAARNINARTDPTRSDDLPPCQKTHRSTQRSSQCHLTSTGC